MAYTFLTGATGLLGRYLIKDLTCADIPVAVLVRPSRRATAQHRVENVMCYWDKQLGRKLPRPIVLEGDITESDLGLDARGTRWVAENCDVMLHNAASLSFQSTGPGSEPWRSNIEGLRNVLELCRNARIRRFHHVSTAYVCGQRQGRILETDLDVGQVLSNDYEQSKLQAEKMVRSAEFLDSLTVFRPAIIIGDSENSFTTTYHGFYAPLQAAHTMARTMEVNLTGRVPTQTRFPLSTYETKNLVPVDWVSAVMAHVISRPEHHGQTYHLTPRHPVTARMLAEVIEESCGFYGVQLVGGGTQIAAPTEIEQLFCELIKVYSSYWKDDPTFDATNTRTAAPHLPCPHVDRKMLLRMANWAIGVNFTSPRAKPVEPRFNVARVLESYLDAGSQATGEGPAAARVGLRVVGHGGGDWTLSLQGEEIVAADVGLHAQRVATVHCDVDLLADLASGRTTIGEALPGQVEVSGESLPIAALTGILRRLSDASQPARSATVAAAR